MPQLLDLNRPTRRQWLADEMRRQYANERMIEIFEAREEPRLTRAGDRAVCLVVKVALIALALDVLLAVVA